MKNDTSQNLKIRTKAYSLRILRLFVALRKETDELTAIFVTIVRNAKSRNV